jgi:hypothetical protein
MGWRQRWTMQELEEWNDNRFLCAILRERLAGLNHYSPLAIRIKQTISRIDKREHRAIDRRERKVREGRLDWYVLEHEARRIATKTELHNHHEFVAIIQTAVDRAHDRGAWSAVSDWLMDHGVDEFAQFLPAAPKGVPA